MVELVQARALAHADLAGCVDLGSSAENEGGGSMRGGMYADCGLTGAPYYARTLYYH